MLTLKESAHVIGSSESYIRNLIEKGTLPATKGPGGAHGRNCWQIDMTRQELLAAVPPAPPQLGTHHKKKRVQAEASNGHGKVNGTGNSRYVRHTPPPSRVRSSLAGLSAWLQLPQSKRDVLIQIGERFTVDDLELIVAL